MDERNIRTERATDVGTDVDIRRSMIMGRDLDAYGGTTLGTPLINARILRWGPIFAGLVTSLVVTFLLGSLFLGFSGAGTYGAFNSLNATNVTAGAVIATIIGVFVGGLLTGYVGELLTVAEGILNGFVVGVMSILAPLFLAVLGAWSAASTAVNAAAQTLPRTTAPGTTAPTVAHNVAASVPPGVTTGVTNALNVAAGNAWMVFISGIIVLALATLGGWLGYKARLRSVQTIPERTVY